MSRSVVWYCGIVGMAGLSFFGGFIMASGDISAVILLVFALAYAQNLADWEW